MSEYATIDLWLPEIKGTPKENSRKYGKISNIETFKGMELKGMRMIAPTRLEKLQLCFSLAMISDNEADRDYYTLAADIVGHGLLYDDVWGALSKAEEWAKEHKAMEKRFDNGEGAYGQC